MILLAPNIYYIPGKNKSQLPYCACMYIVGKYKRILIDAGMGRNNMLEIKRLGIDLLLLTHCHLDHRISSTEIPFVPVWCHPNDAPYLNNRDGFYRNTGIARSGVEMDEIYKKTHGLFDIKVERKLSDREHIDLGGLTLEALHTPGHTPGHLSFYIQEYDILFSGDVDLTRFGPFYGQDFADIDAFLKSIAKLRQLNTKIVVTGHAGPFERNITEKFNEYENVIYKRDRLVLDCLDRPRKLAELRGKKIIYREYPKESFLSVWFELSIIEKHLKRLSALGLVWLQETGLWVRC